MDRIFTDWIYPVDPGFLKLLCGLTEQLGVANFLAIRVNRHPGKRIDKQFI